MIARHELRQGKCKPKEEALALELYKSILKDARTYR